MLIDFLMGRITSFIHAEINAILWNTFHSAVNTSMLKHILEFTLNY